MWRDKYGLGGLGGLGDEGDEQEPAHVEPLGDETEEPQPHGNLWTDEPQVFEVAVYLEAMIVADAKVGDKIPVRLRVRADDYNVGAFTEVLQLNRLPYSVRPAEPEIEEDMEDE